MYVYFGDQLIYHVSHTFLQATVIQGVCSLTWEHISLRSPQSSRQMVFTRVLYRSAQSSPLGIFNSLHSFRVFIPKVPFMLLHIHFSNYPLILFPFLHFFFPVVFLFPFSSFFSVIELLHVLFELHFTAVAIF